MAPTHPIRLALLFPLILLLLSSCGDVDGKRQTAPTFAGIAPGEQVDVTGTEPFWGARITGDRILYSTPETPAGVEIAATRFAGNSGLSFSGALDGSTFDLMITPGACSDGMSDRTYPFVATLRIAGETRRGCAWSQSQPHSAARQP